MSGMETSLAECGTDFSTSKERLLLLYRCSAIDSCRSKIQFNHPDEASEMFDVISYREGMFCSCIKLHEFHWCRRRFAKVCVAYLAEGMQYGNTETHDSLGLPWKKPVESALVHDTEVREYDGCLGLHILVTRKFNGFVRVLPAWFCVRVVPEESLQFLHRGKKSGIHFIRYL